MRGAECGPASPPPSCAPPAAAAAHTAAALTGGEGGGGAVLGLQGSQGSLGLLSECLVLRGGGGGHGRDALLEAGRALLHGRQQAAAGRAHAAGRARGVQDLGHRLCVEEDRAAAVSTQFQEGSPLGASGQAAGCWSAFRHRGALNAHLPRPPGCYRWRAPPCRRGPGTAPRERRYAAWWDADRRSESAGCLEAGVPGCGEVCKVRSGVCKAKGGREEAPRHRLLPSRSMPHEPPLAGGL